MQTCRSCEAPVRWVRSPRGKLMPIDPEPSARGNLVIHESADVVRPANDDDRRRGTPLYLSHFASCPDHNKWRR